MRYLTALICCCAASVYAGSHWTVWDLLHVALHRYTRPRAVVGGGELHLLYQSKMNFQAPVLTCYRRLEPGKGWSDECRYSKAYLAAGHFADALIVFREKSYSIYSKKAWRTRAWTAPWAPAAACRMGQELWVFGADEKEERHRLRAARFTRGEGDDAIEGPGEMGEPLEPASRPLDIRALARGTEALVLWLQTLPAEGNEEGANELWTATFDGERWGEPERAPLPYRNSDYAVALHEGTLWLFAKARGHRISQGRPLQVVRSTRQGWGEPEVVPNAIDSINWTYDIAAASFEGSPLLVRARTASLSIHRWRDGAWGDEEIPSAVSLWPAYAHLWVLANWVAVLALLPVVAYCAFRGQRRPRVLRLSPEVELTVATWGRRAAAMLLDALVSMFLWLLVLRVVLLVHEFDDESASLPAVIMGLHVAVIFAYFVITEGLTGQTLGKRLLNIMVAGQDGRRATLGGIAVRNLLRPPPLIVPVAYLVGSIVLLITPRWQRLGDLLAHTVVVEVPTEPSRTEQS